MRTFQGCGRRWYYRYVARAGEESVAAALLLGGAVHAAVAELLRQRQAGRASDLPAAMAAYDRHWAEAPRGRPVQYGVRDDAGTLRTRAGAALRLFAEGRLPGPAAITAVEEPVTLAVEGVVVPVVGRADLRTQEDGATVITEFKTGRQPMTPGRLREAAGQLALDAAAHGGGPARGRVVLLRLLKTPRVDTAEFDLTEATAAAMSRTLQEVWTLLSAAAWTGTFPPNPSWACGGCPYRRRCEAETGSAV
jgi:hypothetical protein